MTDTKQAQAPAVTDEDHSDQAERDAEELANTYYKPHRFGDGPAWYAACVTACREIASLREKLEHAEDNYQTLLDDAVEVRKQIAGAERKGWNEAIEAAAKEAETCIRCAGETKQMIRALARGVEVRCAKYNATTLMTTARDAAAVR